MPQEFYDFVAANGIPFRALISTRGSFSGEPTVTFFDRRYNFTPNGQPTGASYYLSTLMGSSYERLSESGLCLHGGEPDWTLDARSFRTLANWILEVSS